MALAGKEDVHTGFRWGNLRETDLGGMGPIDLVQDRDR